MPPTVPSLFRLGEFEVDLRAGQLRKRGVKIRLQDQPFRVLAALLEASGEEVTREELRDQLWPADTFVDFDHRLASAISKLRDERLRKFRFCLRPLSHARVHQLSRGKPVSSGAVALTIRQA